MRRYFRVIIPTYNRNIDESVNSVLNQTFDNYILLVSHDDSRSALLEERSITDNRTDLYVKGRRYNGGNRNHAMEYEKDALYTLFLDDDDIITDTDIFSKLYDFIESHNQPDLIRLPYRKRYVSEDRTVTKFLKGENNIETITASSKVAPWTKCIKSELMVSFPENTLFEDVCQHLKQCDRIKTVALFNKPVVEWRIYEGQASRSNSPKWKSSRWRFIADLMDLELEHAYAKKRRNEKLAEAKKDLFKNWENGNEY